MPFFSGRREPTPPPKEPVPPPTESRHHGLFSRRNPSPEATTSRAPPVQPVDSTPRRTGTGIFHRRRSTSPPARTSTTSTSSLSSGGGSFHHTTPGRVGSGRRGILSKGGFHRDDADPSILAARERVMSAETAEQDADRALIAARQSVAAARSEVKRLENEAREEARRAKIKQEQAAEVSKRGKALGRFG